MKSCMRLRAVQKVYPMSKSKIYFDIKNGVFPPPIKIGYSSFWFENEIEAFISYQTIQKRTVDDMRRFVSELLLKRS